MRANSLLDRRAHGEATLSVNRTVPPSLGATDTMATLTGSTRKSARAKVRTKAAQCSWLKDTASVLVIWYTASTELSGLKCGFLPLEPLNTDIWQVVASQCLPVHAASQKQPPSLMSLPRPLHWPGGAAVRQRVAGVKSVRAAVAAAGARRRGRGHV
jgi:hypothetical protein